MDAARVRLFNCAQIYQISCARRYAQILHREDCAIRRSSGAMKGSTLIQMLRR